MSSYSIESRVKLCQRITFLPGPVLKDILDVLRRLEPNALKYVDSQWVFDTKFIGDLALQEIERVVDDNQIASPLLEKSSSLDTISAVTTNNPTENKLEKEIELSSSTSTGLTTAQQQQDSGVDGFVSDFIQGQSPSSEQVVTDTGFKGNTFMVNGVEIQKLKSGRMRCGICKKEFRVRSEVVVHIRTHTGEKPLVCKECGKSFAHPSNLKAHERSHTGEKPYKCKHPGCGKTFAHSTTLKEHSYKHSSIKPYKCRICLKSFSSKAYYKKHVRAHSEKKK